MRLWLEVSCEMKVLVCGQRDFTDREYLFRVLDALHAMHKFTAVIHGAARGADTLAHEWASQRGISVVAYPANWTEHGKAAGPIRNSHMLKVENPDFVVAFFTDMKNSKGTADMVTKALAAGKVVHAYKVDGAVYAIIEKAKPKNKIETYRNIYNPKFIEKWNDHDAMLDKPEEKGDNGRTYYIGLERDDK